MALLTGLALSLVSMAPQGDGPQPLSVLRDSDVKSLNGKVQAWFDIWLQRRLATDTRTRRGLQTRFQRNKDAFLRDWENKQDKYDVPDLLKYVDDLQAVFGNAFPYKRQSTSGTPKRIKPRQTEEGQPPVPEYDLVAPRNYNQRNSYRTVVVIPGYQDGEWQAGDDYFDATWKGSDLASETIFLVPALDPGMDLDPAPDWSLPGAAEAEIARNAALFLPLSDLQSTFRMDRNRVILDCGRASSGWGLRFATYFPSRFAGLILRDPVDPGDLRLESLTALPVLLLRSTDPDNQQAVEKLETALNGLAPGSCTVLDVTDEHPFPAAQQDIDAWARDVKRDLFRSKVVLAPNNDLYNDGYWVEIRSAEPMENLPDADKPKLVVQADRQSNRIEVEAVNIGGFVLSLNDAIVDLDQAFTVVVNGKALSYNRARSLNTMAEGLMDAYDPSWIFTAELIVAVPKGDGDGR